jgi:hypothetical protein
MFRSLFDIQSPRACGQGEMRESSEKTLIICLNPESSLHRAAARAV